MKLTVHEIPKTGLLIEKMLKPAEINLTDEDADSLSPIDLHAQLDRVDTEIIANVKIKGTFHVGCARCLEPLSQEYNSDFIVNYPFEKETDQFDLGDDIRQEILLSVNEHQLCKETCKGLCLGCGANLNIEQCQCSSKKTKTQKNKEEKNKGD